MKNKTKYLIFLLPVLFLFLIFSLVQRYKGEGASIISSVQSPPVPTPSLATNFELESEPSSVSGIFEIKQNLGKIRQELERLNFDDTSLRPPVIEFGLGF